MRDFFSAVFFAKPPMTIVRKMLLLMLVAALPFQGMATAAKLPCALAYPAGLGSSYSNAAIVESSFLKHPHHSVLKTNTLASEYEMAVSESDGVRTHQTIDGEQCDACSLHCHAHVAMLAFPLIDTADSTSEALPISPTSSLAVRQPTRLDRPPKYRAT